MTKRRRELLKLGLLAATGTLLPNSRGAGAASAGYGISGQLAPELSVDYWIDAAGKASAFSLSAHRGKWIFLKCFQSWCPGCHSHGFPALQQISRALAGNPNVVFAGIQTVFEGRFVNTVDKVREIQLRYDLRMPMGHDPGIEDGYPRTMVDFRTGGTPWMILIDPGRRVIYNDFGIDADKAIAYLNAQTG